MGCRINACNGIIRSNTCRFHMLSTACVCMLSTVILQREIESNDGTTSSDATNLAFHAISGALEFAPKMLASVISFFPEHLFPHQVRLVFDKSSTGRG